MTAEEYVKHYASGQGGFESVSVDVALRAIEYARQEAKQKTIDKACKWIDKNAARYVVDRFVGSTRVVGIDASITEDFRKDMED